MKKLLRGAGIALMVMFGTSFVTILSSISKLIRGMKGTPFQNTMSVLIMLAVFAGLFWLGARMYNKSKDGQGQAAKSVPQAVPIVPDKAGNPIAREPSASPLEPAPGDRQPGPAQPRPKRVVFADKAIHFVDGRFWLRTGDSAKPRAITHEEARQIERQHRGYQASMDIGKLGMDPDEAMAQRGFVKDASGQWVPGAYEVDALIPPDGAGTEAPLGNSPAKAPEGPRRYGLGDFKSDVPLKLMTDDPHPDLEYKLGHVVLSNGRVVCMLWEQKMDYCDSSQTLLYPLSLKQYRVMLKEPALTSRVDTGNPLCTANEQFSGPWGTFPAPGPKPYFTEDEAMPHSVSPEEFAAVSRRASGDDPEEALDDITFIRAIRQSQSGPWHQYDVLLDARPYGWAMMVDWAAYLNGADLDAIGTVSVSHPSGSETELVDSYRGHGGDLRQMPELQGEYSALGVGGASEVLGDLLKVVWFNQTNQLRLFTTRDHGARMERYVETLVRRTFGTPDAMKLGKPKPDKA